MDVQFMIMHQANIMHVSFPDLIVLQPILNIWQATDPQAEKYLLSYPPAEMYIPSERPTTTNQS